MLKISPIPAAAPAVETLVQQLKATSDTIVDQLTLVAQDQKFYADIHRQAPPSYSVGDLVLLDATALSKWSIYKSSAVQKLRPKRYGPFKVSAVDGLNITLLLPPTLSIHPTFHVQLISPYTIPDTPLHTGLPADLVDGNEEYEVEAIVGERTFHMNKQYLVKWKGFSDVENSYEPTENLTHCAEKVAAYLALNGSNTATVVSPDVFVGRRSPRLNSIVASSLNGSVTAELDEEVETVFVSTPVETIKKKSSFRQSIDGVKRRAVSWFSRP